MSIICIVAGHEARSGAVYNSGFHFSRCRRCARDMIRSSGDWEIVPGGHRVAWKAGRNSHSIEPDYARVLPIHLPESKLPAVRPSFASWSRHLARLRRPKAPPKAATDQEVEEKEPYPRLLVLAALVAAGLQLVFGFGGRRRELA